MSHTPEPWEISDRTFKANSLQNRRVFLSDDDLDVDGVIVHGPNNEDNARLIAAAPELLGALQAVDAEGRDASKNGDVIIPSHVWDLIQQAIAKATGND